MFPLNWNLPFRKKDGSLVKLNDAMTADVDALKTRVETLEGTVGGNTRDIDSLETFTGALQDQINSDEYSEDEAYTAGDYVIHGNKLYKCNTSCTADTWENNSSYFTEISVADELIVMDSKLNYSSDEQVVGIWIDGSPIYRRCFSGTTPSTSGNPIIDEVIDIKYIINYGISIIDSNGGIGYNFNDTTKVYVIWLHPTTKKLILTASALFLDRPYIMHIDYIKNS